MADRDDFWKLDHLSNEQLIEGLRGVLRVKRQALAELIAHLGEVEQRRIHLHAAHGSMFDYCVSRVGLSEDEACRRIELARLARRFPAIFPLLASGELTLSVALLLRPVLSPENHGELLALVRRASIRQARELLAARFPSPDVPSSMRKLPEPRAVVTSTPTVAIVSTVQPATQSEAGPSAPNDALAAASPLPVPPLALSPPAQRDRVEPLSAQRYKIQFTADAALKEKLELARNLLRHAHPDGDLAPIVSRALELLVNELLQRRFGAGAHQRASRRGARSNAAKKPSVPRAARRVVLERDGLQCTWLDAEGNRCSSRAWLELDHRHPRGKGGNSNEHNVRILCRAHNQLAAELEYGRDHIEQAKTRRRAESLDSGSSPDLRPP